VDELTDPAGLAALGAGAVALIALVLSVVLAVRVRRLRAAQQVVLGGAGQEDLVGHAAGLHAAFVQLHDRVEEVAGQLEQRVQQVERRLDGAITHRDTARLYCKQVLGGRGEHLLSPEEDEAIRRALTGERGTVVLED
jgi:hypothetical protein